MTAPDLFVQLVLTPKVVVDRSDITPGGSGDIADTGAFKAPFAEKLFSGVQKPILLKSSLKLQNDCFIQQLKTTV